MKPLLSICIPTYNRAELLQRMCEAVLPQADLTSGLVEVLIGDNASNDHTSEVAANALKFSSVRYVRHQKNLGPIGNILTLIREYAQGKYIWILGDDDLLLPSALVRVCKALQDNQLIDVFYVNFRIAVYDKHWPESAVGGFDGPFDHVANSELQDRNLTQWIDIVAPENDMCTHIYSHIVMKDMWIHYWQNLEISPVFETLNSTYPHTAMLLSQAGRRPAYYIGDPVLTGFAGSSSWSAEMNRVFLLFLPKLIVLAKRCKMQPTKLQQCRAWACGLMTDSLIRAMRVRDGTVVNLLRESIRHHRGNLLTLRMLWDAVRKAGLRPVSVHVARALHSAILKLF